MEREPMPESQSESVSDRVASIIAAAEHATSELRERTEARARERIAEADRAADNRVQAAEEEAEEILHAAHSQAEQALAGKRAQAEEALASARDEAAQILEEAREQAQRLLAEAESDRASGGEVAREVLREGTELSSNLRDLSVSLRTNAERLLRDVRLAHGGMTARLDQASPRAGPRAAARGHDEPGDDLGVPEFIPRR